MRRSLLPLCVLAASLCSCFRNPATGKLQLDLVSESQEVGLGKQGAQDVERSVGLYHDPKLEPFVAALGQRLARVTPRPQLPWQFHIVDDPAINAFALPGGPVYITRGLLGTVNSEAELASVVGHECGHIAARHSANMISKQQLAQVGLGVGAILSPTVRALGQAAGAGLQLLFLKFSRDDEDQADQLGFGYAADVGYDSRAMIDLFRTLERVGAQSGAAGKVPEWAQTHPIPEHRLETTQKRIAETKRDFGKTAVNRDAYLALIDGLAYGADPRQGYFRGETFFHPGLKFRLEMPQGWKTVNQPEAVLALAPGKDALFQLEPGGAVAPAEVARQFFSQQGVKQGPAVAGSIHGLSSVAAYFEAQTQQGVVEGLVTFLGYAGQTYVLLGYTAQGALSKYEATFRQTMASFAELTDKAALEVQPARLKIVAVERETTIEELGRKYPSQLKPAELALINGLDPAGSLREGQRAKVVVGGLGPAGAP
ncbi:MAG: M48 family metalloprotease [Myxococcales bacterium]